MAEMPWIMLCYLFSREEEQECNPAAKENMFAASNHVHEHTHTRDPWWKIHIIYNAT